VEGATAETTKKDLALWSDRKERVQKTKHGGKT